MLEKILKKQENNISLRRDAITSKKFTKRYPMLSGECWDLIVKLITTSQHQRIGKTNSVNEILAHDWFTDIDLTSIQEQTFPSPIYDIVTDEESIMELTNPFAT